MLRYQLIIIIHSSYVKNFETTTFKRRLSIFSHRMINISDIKNKNFKLCIVGMGRIGLPLSVSFAMKGVRVFGVEKREETLQILKKGKTPFYEPGMQEALDKSLESGNMTFVSDYEFSFENCHIIIVAVGTPLKENLLPDMSLILDVVSKISKQAADNSIMILRSTLVPGTAENRILPYIKRINNSLHIAVCPERIVEGNAIKEIAELPEIIGVDNETIGDIVRELFLILGPKEIAITTTKTAEAAKIFTNVYRYVTFALANEFALMSENLNIDATEAIRLANNGYPRSKIPVPGPSAGPCLRKDALFLSNNSAINLTKVAWLLNESIPIHIIEAIKSAYGNIFGKKIGVLGKTYKANVDDVRDSPSIRLIQELEIKGANVLSYDPYTLNSNTLEEVLRAEIVILAVNHAFFDTITAEMLKRSKLVYDTWGQFSELHLELYGIKYIWLGRGAWNPQELTTVKY
jgi:UDP-N-acetyl-D-mannosaminuronic acid dehydrogenase